MLIFKLIPLLAGALLLGSPATAAGLERIEETSFGKMPDGKSVKAFTLRNANGATAQVIEHGAIITKLQFPDRKGAFTNVVLGAKSLNEYLNGFPGSAAVIGRFANRIAGRASRSMALNTNSLPTTARITFMAGEKDSPAFSGKAEPSRPRRANHRFNSVTSAKTAKKDTLEIWR